MIEFKDKDNLRQFEDLNNDISKILGFDSEIT